MTDEEIALRVQQGNREDFASLVERHLDPLVGYLYRMLDGNREQAEDLAQETFEKAMRKIASYTYPRPFKPWLYAIAIHLARNFYEGAETRRVTAGNEVLDKLTDGADSVEAEVAQRAENDQMAALLDKLPAHQRETVILRYVAELSLAEIAEALDVPVGTVKSRISLGLSRLRKLMQESHKP